MCHLPKVPSLYNKVARDLKNKKIRPLLRQELAGHFEVDDANYFITEVLDEGETILLTVEGQGTYEVTVSVKRRRDSGEIYM